MPSNRFHLGSAIPRLGSRDRREQF
jgi:hypothetical protein